jgi:hypothetical protein
VQAPNGETLLADLTAAAGLPSDPEMTPTVLRGRPAQLGRRDGLITADIELPGRRLLTVQNSVGFAADEQTYNLTQVANEIIFGADPDRSWLGQR